MAENKTELLKHTHWTISRDNICTHVTALKIFGNLLLIAEGNQVILFDIFLKKNLKKEIVFRSSSIHGIRSNNACKFLFFGSKSLKVYSWNPESTKCFSSISEEIILADWIQDAQWIEDSDGAFSYIAVILAHNSITILDVYKSNILKNVQCSENCILYSASILLAHENIVVAAVGTVFQQILLWSPNSVSENTVKIPFHRLEGHQGVIFSICYNKNRSLLSSSSDDRSIRLWKIHPTNELEDNSTLEYWEKANISPSHILYAHESRVWTSVILDECIISVGEDSNICFWDMNGKLLKKKKCHKNGSIWCLETNYWDQKSKPKNNCIAFTGGSDGGVYCWNVQDVIHNELVSQISLNNRSPSNQDFPRIVSILPSKSNSRIMMTTNLGWLLFYDMNTHIWKDIHYNESFLSYCVSAVSNKGHIAVANLTGDLVLLSYNENMFCASEAKKFKIHNSKIISLHWLDKKELYLVSCGTNGHLILCKVFYEDLKYSLTKMYDFDLPKCKPHWWSTCATSVFSTNSLIVGDRAGSIHFYNLIESFEKKIDPSITHKYIHGENGVTDIQEHQSFIYSAGRDGRVLLFTIDKKSLTFLHTIKIPHDLEWIGRMLFYNSNLLLLGFHTKYFVVWSTELESTVMSVDCGGGHRSWDFHLTENGMATFSAIKKKDIMFAVEDLSFTLNRSIIKRGISGREFCQTCYLFTVELSNSNPMAVFAVGGEDNALQIIGIINKGTSSCHLRPLHYLAGHLSSIRSLSKIKMNEKDTFLMASVGGRAQMILWKVKKDSSIMCQQLSSFILFAAEKRSKKPWKENQEIQPDPQTRLMDVSLSEDSLCVNERYFIALACSDSFFRVYAFGVIGSSLTLLFAMQPNEHCILRVSCIQNFEESENYKIYLITGTDGIVNFVNDKEMKAGVSLVNPKMQTCNRTHVQSKLHQSGINAIDVRHLFGISWLVCTAGDDNAISALLIEIDESLNADYCVKVLTETTILNAHASQITGLKICDSETIVSVSVDQRINLWKWNLENNILNIIFETSQVSLIPDIAHIECWKNNNDIWTFIICGEGIEILSAKYEM